MFAQTSPSLSGQQINIYCTRHRNKLDVALFRTATIQQSFVYGATRLWNELPQTLTDVNSLVNFKATLKSCAWKNFIVT